MRRLLLGMYSAGLLAGCSSVQAPVAKSELPAKYAVSGRVAVQAHGKGYPAARFEWKHDNTAEQVDLSNPLGQVVARLELSSNAARYTDSNGQLHEAADIETLTERALGWRLPAEGLRYWLLGLAAPGREAHWSRSETGKVLEQDGWQIRYKGLDGSMPDGLTLSRPELEIRILLSDWQLAYAQP
ncbi:lipoprotein insertase outer membrane protein LolB [Chitinimonas sp.]|uniref:lipoprotein insertase outer membrane protein LolB n=1 Tax=Chitinimonas sp. TaxID=1934313 RepID=UPI0035B13530